MSTVLPDPTEFEAPLPTLNSDPARAYQPYDVTVVAENDEERLTVTYRAKTLTTHIQYDNQLRTDHWPLGPYYEMVGIAEYGLVGHDLLPLDEESRDLIRLVREPKPTRWEVDTDYNYMRPYVITRLADPRDEETREFYLTASGTPLRFGNPDNAQSRADWLNRDQWQQPPDKESGVTDG